MKGDRVKTVYHLGKHCAGVAMSVRRGGGVGLDGAQIGL